MSRPAVPVLQVRADGRTDLRLPPGDLGRTARQALAMLLPDGSWLPGVDGSTIRLREEGQAPALAILEHYYGGSVRIMDPEPAAGGGDGERPSSVSLPDPSGLDREMARRLYRRMAETLHPDKGGSTELFQLLQGWKDLHGL